MLVSHSHKFMFFHPSRKTGGTSVAVALGHVSKDPYSDMHLRPSHVRTWMPDEFATYFKFAFVRNPWDRMVSCWSYDLMVTKKFQRGAVYYQMSFADYLQLRVVKQKGFWSSPQFNFLHDGEIELVNFTGRFESIQDDFDIACGMVGVGKIMLPERRNTKHKHYSEYYDKATKELVADVFAKDVEAYEYSF